MSDDAGTGPSDDNDESSSPDEINLFAGIDAYRAAKEAAKRTQDYAASAAFQSDAMEAGRKAVARLRDQATGLDKIALAQVRKAVRANEDWLEVERKKLQAAADAAAAQPVPDDDGEAGPRAAESIREPEKDQERIEESLLLQQAILTESKASSQSLRQIRSAHDLAERRQVLADKRQGLADKRQGEQEKKNRRFTVFGSIIAVASLLASIGMPMWQHYVWDAEKEKKASSNTAAPQTSAVQPPATSAVESTATPRTGQECNPAHVPARYLACLVPIQTGP